MLQILSKRSSCADKRPDPANLANGELAINFNSTSSNVFYKNNCGCLNVVGAASVSAIAPNSCATGYCGNSPGEFWFDTSSSALKIWNGSSWFGISSGSSAGTVTSIIAGSGLTGGTITTSGTIALATSGVSAGTYTYACVDIDCYGRITSASCGAAPVVLSTVTAKGDLIAGTAADTVSALPVGTDGQVLSADSNCATGLAWVDILTPAATPTALGTVFGQTTCGAYAPVSLGICSLACNTTGTANVAVGPSSLKLNTTGSNNTAVGADALCKNTAGFANTSVGQGTLNCNTTGCGNTVMGVAAMYYNTTTGYNTAVGYLSLNKNVGGGGNTSVGSRSLACNYTGYCNTSIGSNSMYGNNSGVYNTALGVSSLGSNIDGSCNVALGLLALAANCSGCCNTAVGTCALVSTCGSNNVGIGFNVTVDAPACNSQLVIGWNSGCNWLTGCSDHSIKPAGGIRDCAGSLGTAGQCLSSTGTALVWASPQDATTGQKGVVQIGTNINVASGTISVASASTSTSGIVQLNDSTASTSTTEALTAAQGKNLQDQIDALVVTSNLIFGGTFDASTGFVDSVSTAGTDAGLVVGEVLPVAGAGNENVFVIVDVGGTVSQEAPTLLHVGDWFLSDGTVWQFLDVGFQAPSATTTTEGIVYLATSLEVQTGADNSKAVVPLALQAKVSDSISTASSTCIASSAAVKCAYDLANIALPSTVFYGKGVLAAGTGVSTYQALGPGSNGDILVSDSACTTGLKWIANPVTSPATPNVAGTVFGYTCSCEGLNTSLGFEALKCFVAIYGSVGNTAIGKGSMATICTGRYNSALGYEALAGIVNGRSNIGIGHNAGYALTNEEGNVIIGNYPGQIGGNCNMVLADGCGTIRMRFNCCGALGTSDPVFYGCPGYVLSSQGGACPWTWCPASSGVTCVTAGSGLCGGPIVTTGSLCLDTNCVIGPANYTDNGALIVGYGAGIACVLNVGTAGQILTVDISCAVRMKWATPAFISCTAYTAKGDLLSASAASTPSALPVGTNGQVLTACSTCTTGLTWSTITQCTGTVTSVAAGAGLTGTTITGAGTLCLDTACVIQPTVLTAKGSLISASAASTPTALAVGTDGQVLTACAACTSGLTWAAGGSSSCPATPSVAGTVYGCTTCSTTFNTFLGATAGNATTAGTVCNTALGFAALLQATGFNNTAIGMNAGRNLTTGCSNVAIGWCAQVASATGSNQLAIGWSATCNWLKGDSCKNLHPGGGILSTAGSLGGNGQVLTACDGGCGVCWAALPDQTPVGTIAFFAMCTAPTGWTVADGSCVSRSTFSALFAAIGTTYGAGNGSTTFQLPDLRGRFVRGWNGTASGCDPNRVFGCCQTNNAGPHNHTLCAAPGSSADASSQGWTPTSGIFATLRTTDRSALPGDTRITSAGCNVAMACAGCCIGSETRPDNIAMLPCIKSGNSNALGVDATPTVAGAVLGCTNNLIHNTTLGCNAGAAITATTCCMTAIGKNALNLATGNNNTAIGMNAGCTLTTGANNTLIGFNAAPSAITVSNEITLGNSSITAIRAQVTSITSLSDGRDKTHIRDIPIGLDFLNSIRPVEFKWNMRDGGKVGVTDTGFIAQDLQEIQEEIGYTLPGLVYEENPDRLEAAYGKLLPVLVKAIQELSEKNAELERRIRKLEG